VTPSCVADTEASAPLNLPTGVRAAARITTSYNVRKRNKTEKKGVGTFRLEEVAYVRLLERMERGKLRRRVLCIFVGIIDGLLEGEEF
jgi:hypothetical protein